MASKEDHSLLYCMLGIRIALLITQHFQSDRQLKCANQKLDQYLMFMTLLSNIYIFFLDTDYFSQMCFKLYHYKSKLENIMKFTEQMKAVLEKVKSTTYKSQKDIILYYN